MDGHGRPFAPAIGGPETGGLDDLAAGAADDLATTAPEGGGAATRVFWTGGDAAKSAATDWATAQWR
jgi:hypothetical protein